MWPQTEVGGPKKVPILATTMYINIHILKTFAPLSLAAVQILVSVQDVFHLFICFSRVDDQGFSICAELHYGRFLMKK